MGAGVRAEYAGGEILIVGDWVYRVSPGSTIIVTATAVKVNGVEVPPSTERATKETKVDRVAGKPLVSAQAIGAGAVAGHGNIMIQGGTPEANAQLEALFQKYTSWS